MPLGVPSTECNVHAAARLESTFWRIASDSQPFSRVSMPIYRDPSCMTTQELRDELWYPSRPYLSTRPAHRSPGIALTSAAGACTGKARPAWRRGKWRMCVASVCSSERDGRAVARCRASPFIVLTLFFSFSGSAAEIETGRGLPSLRPRPRLSCDTKSCNPPPPPLLY